MLASAANVSLFSPISTNHCIGQFCTHLTSLPPISLACSMTVTNSGGNSINLKLCCNWVAANGTGGNPDAWEDMASGELNGFQ